MVNSGKWEDDKACGQGTLKYSNGDHYEGEWTDDQRNGTSDYRLLSNHLKRFSHVIFLRLSEGNGKFTSSETNITYSGSWRDGLKEGVGSLFFPSGDVLTGRWKEVGTHTHTHTQICVYIYIINYMCTHVRASMYSSHRNFHTMYIHQLQPSANIIYHMLPI